MKINFWCPKLNFSLTRSWCFYRYVIYKGTKVGMLEIRWDGWWGRWEQILCGLGFPWKDKKGRNLSWTTQCTELFQVSVRIYLSQCVEENKNVTVHIKQLKWLHIRVLLWTPLLVSRWWTTFILYTTKTTYICLQLYVIVEVLLISCLSNYMKPFMIADLTVFSSVFFNGKLIIMVNDCIDRATKIQIKIHLLMVCNLLKTINWRTFFTYC